MSCSSCFRCGGSSMVCRTVSTIQPRMSFRVPQLPSPFRSFFKETASFRLSSGSGRASTSSTQCSSWRRRSVSCCASPCPAWMKSSTNTSVDRTAFLSMQFESGAGRATSGSGLSVRPAKARSAALAGQSSTSRGAIRASVWMQSCTAASSSRRWGTGFNLAPSRAFVRSAMVSDMVQNVAGDCTHPMVHAMGMAMSCSSPS
jgi:hypothetical protein